MHDMRLIMREYGIIIIKSNLGITPIPTPFSTVYIILVNLWGTYRPMLPHFRIPGTTENIRASGNLIMSRKRYHNHPYHVTE